MFLGDKENLDAYDNPEIVPDVEVTLEKVTADYEFVYVPPKRNIKPTDTCVVTTRCPKCDKQWSQTANVWQVLQYPAMFGLCLCSGCTPDENIAMVGNNKVWSKQ